MNGELNGKVALVTGAARGLGELVARDLARDGMAVAGTDMRADEVQKTMTAIGGETGARTLAVPADVGDEAQVVDVVRRTIREFGRIEVS